MKKLVIIPAYNEEQTIVRVCNEIREKAPEYDLVVINDCSTDQTAALCRANGIKVIDLPVNHGIGGAMQTGYRYAANNDYDIAVQVDGDGQHDSLYIGTMYEALVSEGADLVIGSRFLENAGYKSTRLRRLGIRYFSLLIRLLTGCTVTDPTSGFRMAGRRLMEDFAKDYPRDYPKPESIVRAIKHGGRLVEVPVRMRQRAGGVSSISLKDAVCYMIKVTVAIILGKK
ncbi:MAG: glycosyltransferase family 2 protein [Lachnospiraceae bacterium]|nr:glycosyltransferase family 2 protein [Lachnospiraceae bacterium]